MTNRIRPGHAAFAALVPLVMLALGQMRPPDTGARSVIDDIGRRVVVPAKAQRVVSLAPNVTEILYALGVEGEIAGITDFTELPPGAAPKPSMGEPTGPNLERIAALHPDLVLVAGTINRWETMESIDRLGIPVYATDPHTVEGMIASVRHIASLVGAAAAGEELAASLEARLATLRTRLASLPPKRVLFVVWEDPLITTGQGTFVADALRWAGADSVVNVSEDWPHLSIEDVVRLQPDALVFPTTHTGEPGDIARTLRGRPGWRSLNAVREDRVLVVSDAINRPSPALIGVIEQLARELHPEAFAPAGAPQPPGRQPPQPEAYSWLR